jgi:hypothetical protein
MCIRSYRDCGEALHDVTGNWLQLHCGSGRRMTRCNWYPPYTRHNSYLSGSYRIHYAFHCELPRVRTHVCRHEGHPPTAQWISLFQRERCAIAFSLYIIKISWNQRLRAYKPFLYVNIAVSCLSVTATNERVPRGHNKMLIRGDRKLSLSFNIGLFSIWYGNTKSKCIWNISSQVHPLNERMYDIALRS